MIIRIEIPNINPIPKERPRHNKNKITFTPTRTRTYESGIKKIVKELLEARPEIVEQLNRLHAEHDKIGIVAQYRRLTHHHADTDNLTKSLKDGLEKALWKNDNCIKGEVAYLTQDKQNYGVTLLVMPYNKWLEQFDISVILNNFLSSGETIYG